jgi:hypothetical protein
MNDFFSEIELVFELFEWFVENGIKIIERFGAVDSNQVLPGFFLV